MTFPAGLSAFPITPADAAGRLDTGALRALLTRLMEAKVDSIGLLGSTGTYMYLSLDERRRVLEAALEIVGGALPVVVGIGALRTDHAVLLARHAAENGAAAGLLAPVSYAPLSEDEVFGHFSAVAGESGLPICIYDNPGTTRFNFTPQLLARLADVQGIIAIKNAAGTVDETVENLRQRRALLPAGFSIGCSGDWTATETLIAGADVWHGVLAGLLPGTCLKIVRAAQAGDHAEARRLDGALAPVFDLMRRFSGLRVTYALAGLLGLGRAVAPRPILPLPEPARLQLDEAVAHLPQELLR